MNRIPPMPLPALLPALLLPTLLAACANQAPPTQAQDTTPRVIYQADRTGGAARCDVGPRPADGAGADVRMQVGNDGGWCAVLASAPGHTPYAAGLLTARPSHGTVTVHSVGYDTRLDYVPDHGYAGADSFAVTLLPGHPVIRVTVAVQR